VSSRFRKRGASAPWWKTCEGQGRRGARRVAQASRQLQRRALGIRNVRVRPRGQLPHAPARSWAHASRRAKNPQRCRSCRAPSPGRPTLPHPAAKYSGREFKVIRRQQPATAPCSWRELRRRKPRRRSGFREPIPPPGCVNEKRTVPGVRLRSSQYVHGRCSLCFSGRAASTAAMCSGLGAAGGSRRCSGTPRRRPPPLPAAGDSEPSIIMAVLAHSRQLSFKTAAGCGAVWKAWTVRPLW